MSTASRERPTVAHVVGQTLAALDVEHVFGVVGSGNLVVTNALRAGGAIFIAARHEAGAVTMADAYARARRCLGVCSVHQGPGLTNTLTGLIDAAKSHTPLLVIAGDTSDGATRSNFYIPQSRLVELLGAGSERIAFAADAAETTVRAAERAVTERRPVVLHLPLDVQKLPATALEVAMPRPGSVDIVHPSVETVDQLVKLLTTAQRPLLIAGRGAWSSDAGPALEELREAVDGLLATTAAAHGIFADHPWSLGICGGFSSPRVGKIIAEADLVVGFGAMFTKWTTREGAAFDRRATVIQLDDDVAALALEDRVDVGLQGDVAATVVAVTGVLREQGQAPSGWATSVTADRVHESGWPHVPYQDESTADRIDPRTLSLVLDDLLSKDRTVVIDGGHFVGFPSMYWSVPDPAGYLFTGAGYQSIGLGIGGAIGAAVARPDRTVVLAVGDGGLHMSVSELDTLGRLQLPLLIVVYNDAAYGAEVHHFQAQGEDIDLVQFPDSDFVGIAQSFGVPGVTVRQREDLSVVDEWLQSGKRGPLLLDCKVVPTVVANYQAEAFHGH